MPLLYFTDILNKAGIDPKKTKLLRHAMNDEHFRLCYNANLITEYTAHQKRDFSRGYQYWAVFISDKGNYARLHALYEAGDYVPDNTSVEPNGWPIEKDFLGNGAYYQLKRIPQLEEYEGRLLIDWGKSARMWHQKGTTQKPIIAIESAHKIAFPGYENLVLSYQKLKEVVENKIDYDQWHAALSSVNAVYLIVDTQIGKQYIGSAYGQGGLLERWRCYVESLHGNNKLMRELIRAKPEQYQHFQFSILQLLDKTVTNDEVVHIESLWKKKLQTIKFGMNDN